MINARNSFNRFINENKDPGVDLLAEAHQPWTDRCYRIEWLSAEVPLGGNRYARNVRIHIRSKDEGTDGVERRAIRLEGALKLPKNEGGIATIPEYDYFSDMDAPSLIGNLEIQRSQRGWTVIDPPDGNPTLRHIVLSLVVVYRKR